VLYLWQEAQGERRLLYGKPMDERAPGEHPPANGIHSCHFTPGGNLLFITALFDDAYGLGTLDLLSPAEVHPVTMSGARHTGAGELTELERIRENRYVLTYNIDGVSWAYEGTFDEPAHEMRLATVLCGGGELAGGVLEAIHHDPSSDRYALSFSTALSPTQLYTLEGSERRPRLHTRERILGIPKDWLAPGEDASFTSHDGLRCSARLYLPCAELGVTAPFPLVYYIHGGPQGQERPNFAWFSMPLIQFLTLNGFAVFVPNVRGSTGYGQEYANRVNHDWGGQDRLDHVHAMQVLAQDARIDTTRTGVMGRSYGGYMTLTLAGRHPELWRAAIDLFGPYNMLTFIDRLPESWKPLTKLFIGDPETERDYVVERSPETYIDNITCPLFVIQGKNDPRVVEQESRDLVDHLRGIGKQVEYLMFENEGHDVLKFENKVRCYTAITEFFRQHL
jgi:dipeptidyl aminopeptidase/acylaminoacyl peptidase